MKRKHIYILIFGGLSVCYLLFIIAIGYFDTHSSDAAGPVAQTVRVTARPVARQPLRYVALPDGTYTTEPMQTKEPAAYRTPAASMTPVPSGTPVVSMTPMPSMTPMSSGTPMPSMTPASSENPAFSATFKPAAGTPSAVLAEATPRPEKTESPIFYGYKNVSKERRQVVEMAKEYVGKIDYHWGGKPSGQDIEGKTEPNRLDCSGFIQFIYSKVAGERQNSIGATISIAKLNKIGKDSLKPGDIGLKKGTGSLYFDADGRSYGEPGAAEAANDRRVRAAQRSIESMKDKISDADALIEKKLEKIEVLAERKSEIYRIAKTLGKVRLTEERNTFVILEAEDEEFEERLRDYRKKYRELYKRIAVNRSSVWKLREKKKTWREKILEEKAVVKKYDKEVIRSIDHVGIYCGKDKKGREIWCHCSSSGHGVVWQNTDIFRYYYRYLD